MGGGGTDRFYGFRGISNGENPNFVHKSAATMEELAPVTEIEKAREIKRYQAELWSAMLAFAGLSRHAHAHAHASPWQAEPPDLLRA